MRIDPRYPAPSLIGKLPAHIRDIYMDTVTAVQHTRFQIEMDALQTKERKIRSVFNRHFWNGFLEGFGAIGLFYGGRVDYPAPLREERPSADITNLADGYRIGHDMRCAMQMLMDEYNLDARILKLTPAEEADLESCDNPKRFGNPVYAQIRALGLDGLKYPVQSTPAVALKI